MVILRTSSNDGHPIKPRSGLQRAGIRVALGLSLLVAALGGATVAVELRPDHHALAAHHEQAIPRPLPHPVLHVLPVQPQAPAALSHAVLTLNGGKGLTNGSWIDATQATFRIAVRGVPRAAGVRAQVELKQADVPFSGTPNLTGQLMRIGSTEVAPSLITTPALVDGLQYHWRSRLVATNGLAGPWSGGGVFGVSRTAPIPPQLSTTNVRLGGWLRTSRLIFRWNPSTSVAPVAFYEYAVVPAGLTAQQAGVLYQQAHGLVLTLPHQPDGRWLLLVRAVDQTGKRSPSAAWAFGVARHAPAAPMLVAASPADGEASNTLAPTIRWQEPRSHAPIRGFQYRVLPSTDLSNVTSRWVPLHDTSLHLLYLADLGWTVQVRAVDAAGNISQPLRWSFRLDREHPLLTSPVLSATSFTAPIERLSVRMGLGKRANVSYSIYTPARTQAVRTVSLGLHDPGPLTDLVWNGKLANGRVAPAGDYIMVVSAVDAVGNRTEIRSAPVSLLNKRILISISKDQMWAYQGDKLLLSTLVTNGGSDTPTLPGIFHVEEKDTGKVFHSPWPVGSPLWYPDSPTNFALLYNADGGYFVHDAPWRDYFGPGSNSVTGTPGGNYTGTHGCTNVPYSAMATIFNWADIGTLIQIVP